MTEFKKQRFGADVATIIEREDDVLEVTRRTDGKFDLTVHRRWDNSSKWDDITITLEARHFIQLGSIADMTLCLEPDCPQLGKTPSRSCGCHPRNEQDLA